MPEELLVIGNLPGQGSAEPPHPLLVARELQLAHSGHVHVGTDDWNRQLCKAGADLALERVERGIELH